MSSENVNGQVVMADDSQVIETDTGNTPQADESKEVSSNGLLPYDANTSTRQNTPPKVPLVTSSKVAPGNTPRDDGNTGASSSSLTPSDTISQQKTPRRLPPMTSSKVAPVNVDPVKEKLPDIDKKDSNDDDKKDSKDDEKSEKEKEEEETKSVGALAMFKFADCWDIILMVIGTICACANGAALPGMIILFGQLTDTLVENGQYSSILDTIAAFLASVSLTKAECLATPSLLSPHLTTIASNYTTVDINVIQKQIDTNFLDTMGTYSIYFICIGCGVLVAGYAQVAFWSLASERQSHRIRQRFFRSVLRQEIGWFDTHESGQLTTRLSEDINKIHEGIGDKVGSFFQWFSGFLTGFIIGFVYGWKLTLVILSVSPLIAAASAVFENILTSMTSKELEAYAKAGAVAEEVLSSIRTVAAFGGQKKESERYNANLEDARQYGIKKGLSNGLSFGIVYLIVFCSYALGFWYGAKLTRDEPDNYTIGNCLTVFFSVLIGAFSLGNAFPKLQSFFVAKGAAYTVYEIIDLVPDIDSSSEAGMKLDHIDGNITFKNVHFRYPAREEVQVLKGVDLDISKGQTVALVGSSGCGKSTVVQLIQRFYDPEDGQVSVDGNDVKDINLRWLREHIGVVSQEPVLFATTIAENIRFGKDGVSQEEIEAAAKMANAHNFISDLPDKYETMVGERGAQLSGGQKQRVAIARALVKDPKILLLDEATSALDTESEAVVQEALDKARAGRTTVVVAHRLSTIKTADIIAGFKDGVVVEKGSHDQLMQKGGVYQQLVTLQTKNRDKEADEIVEEYTRAEKKETPGKMLKSQISTMHLAKDEKHDKVETDSEDKKDEEEPQGSFTRILRMSAPEWYLILLGCLGSLVFGGVQPSFAVIFANIVGVFGTTDTDYQERQVRMYVLILCGLGGACFLALTAQGYFFGRIGENLTLRLRRMAFKAMLRQEIAYFDDPKNSTGALTTRLATEASEVHGAAGVRIGKFIESLANIGTAIIISFIYGWKLTLVILAFLPLIAVSGALEMQVLKGVAGKNKEALEDAGKIATEGIDNMRTVAGLGMEDKVFKLYAAELESPYRNAIKKLHLTGLMFSFSQAMIYFAYAGSFYFGAYLIEEGEMDFDDVFLVFTAIVFGGMALGEASSFAPNASKATVAAGHIFALLDRVPAIDSDSEEGENPPSYTSIIKFRDCKFHYPTRPDVKVLQGLTLSVAPGETLALVGASGCGKSTTVQMIERFYDPEEGDVELDNYELRTLNIQWLRSQIGIVSQEPVLFDCSIAENIAYGDNSRVVDMNEIIAAARSANIHQFIDSLPNGYDTNVGSKGTQLSGGQKQRVAIARALVRNPKILLLDEATSALDTESEKVVQEALDKAREGRTCIVIAHRLSTIRNADKICVIKHGQVAEEGRHGDLMSKQGIYYRLNTAQASKS